MLGTSADEPIILTLSSDEESDEPSTSKNGDLSTFVNINPKEPFIKPNDTSQCKITRQSLSDFRQESFVAITCRRIKIGSYICFPVDRPIVSTQGLKMTVPSLKDRGNVVLTIHLENMVKVLYHFGSNLSVMFLYVSDAIGKSFRRQLDMLDSKSYFFDPCSSEQSQRRITLLMEELAEGSLQLLLKILDIEMEDGERHKVKLSEQLTKREAFEILARSSTVEDESPMSTAKSKASFESQTLLVFPPAPMKGGISVTLDDYFCLKDEEFLNDVLIDFYLKWLHTCQLSEWERSRTHIFSTFFYKRLTSKSRTSIAQKETESTLTSAERRHARVKSWTKNVDIFSKDFLFIPINEDSHWFLAVICFPGLEQPVRLSDGQPVPRPEITSSFRTSKRRRKEVIPGIGEETEDISTDRDEADDEDEGLDGLFEDEDPEPQFANQFAIKQPCILVFDSLCGNPRGRIVATLREYLAVEHRMKKKTPRPFNKETIPGSCPSVPQQMNFSDCGLFVLQFAQSFFERPLKDFQLPIHSVVNWFRQDEVGRKREVMASLIRRLMEEQRPNNPISLPNFFQSEAPDTHSSPRTRSPETFTPNDKKMESYTNHRPSRWLDSSDQEAGAGDPFSSVRTPEEIKNSIKDIKVKLKSVSQKPNQDLQQKQKSESNSSLSDNLISPAKDSRDKKEKLFSKSSSETTKSTSEAKNATSETTKVTSETTTVDFETKNATSETTKVNSETKNATSETTKVTSENTKNFLSILSELYPTESSSDEETFAKVILKRKKSAKHKVEVRRKIWSDNS